MLKIYHFCYFPYFAVNIQVFQCYLDVSDGARRVIKVKLKGMQLNESHSREYQKCHSFDWRNPSAEFSNTKIRAKENNQIVRQSDGRWRAEGWSPTTLNERTHGKSTINATVGPEHHLHHFYFQRVKSAKLSRRKEEEEASVREWHQTSGFELFTLRLCTLMLDNVINQVRPAQIAKVSFAGRPKLLHKKELNHCAILIKPSAFSGR
jgi:hypothetical protein